MRRVGAVAVGVLAAVVAAGCTVATTDPASDVGVGSATLRGHLAVVHPTAAQWWFEYGTGALDHSTLPQSAPSAFNDAVAQVVNDLEPGTTYGYRLCGSDSQGRHCGARLELTTPPAPPAGTLAVSPGTGLDPAGDEVVVEGTGWPAGAAVELTQVLREDPRAPGRHAVGATVTVVADDVGAFAAALPIELAYEPGFGVPRAGVCRAPYCAVEARVVGGWPRAHEPIAFDTPAADLRVTQTVDANPASLGGSVTFTVTVTNVGPDAADDVTLDSYAEALATPGVTGTTSGSGSCGGPAVAEAIASCDLGTLGAGEEVTVLVTLQPNEDGPLVHIATAASTAAEAGSPADNVAVALGTSVVGA